MTKEAYALTWVTEQLAVGGAPLSYAQLDSLRRQGVDAILNLCGEYTDLHDIEAGHGFEVRYLPVEDEHAPDMEAMDAALAWLDEAIYLGKKVLIHCRHGIGRTGTLLNAYILRRGLGHKGAKAILKGLKSQPANFQQWWAIRRYAKANPRLELREPSLEARRRVDLKPFLDDYASLTAQAEDLVEQGGDPGHRCGREHDVCCRVPVSLTLVEAVRLARAVDLLGSAEREAAMGRAAEALAAERRAGQEAVDAADSAEFCLSDAGTVCPLLVDGACELYEHRPLRCRLHDLDQDLAAELWDDVLAPVLGRLSGELFLSFCGAFPEGDLPRFSLAEVVSGRYVAGFFHCIPQGRKAG